MGEKCIAAALHASVSVFGKMLGALNLPMPWWQADRFPFVPNVNANTDGCKSGLGSIDPHTRHCCLNPFYFQLLLENVYNTSFNRWVASCGL